MQIVEHRVGGVTILELKGRLILEEGDVAVAEHVEALVRQGRVKLLLDMCDVTRLDSAGIGMLVRKYLTAHDTVASMKLLHLRPHRPSAAASRSSTPSSSSSSPRTRRFAALRPSPFEGDT